MKTVFGDLRESIRLRSYGLDKSESDQTLTAEIVIDLVGLDHFSIKTISNGGSTGCLATAPCPPWPKIVFSVANAAEHAKVSPAGVPSTVITNLQLVWYGGISADIR